MDVVTRVLSNTSVVALNAGWNRLSVLADDIGQLLNLKTLDLRYRVYLHVT